MLSDFAVSECDDMHRHKSASKLKDHCWGLIVHYKNVAQTKAAARFQTFTLAGDQSMNRTLSVLVVTSAFA